MSRAEKYLPFVLALFVPALSYINSPVDLTGHKRVYILASYVISSMFLLGIWFYNRWLLNKDFLLKKWIGLNASVIVANALLIAAIGFIHSFRVVDPNLPSWLIMFRITLATVIFNVTLRVFRAQKMHAQLKMHNLSLQSDNLKFQIETLKQQINPHFLFNSLNTLLDLVEDDSKSASGYIRNFSNLYRSVLQSSKMDFIQLRDELQILNDYWRLLKIRFKHSIDLSIEIDEDKLDSLIPPLSLQLLVENAVKHNEATVEKPLTISIEFEDDHLIVSNKMNVKTYPEHSEKVGLRNLQQRFTALHRPINFGVENDMYVVRLPLKNG